MQRRDFLTAAAGSVAALGLAPSAEAVRPDQPIESDREYMAGLLQRIAEPVLSRMAAGQLKRAFPLEVSPTWDGRPREVAYLECFGRLMAGVAPWLALPPDDTAEGRVRQRLTRDALASYAHAVDPASPDYLAWRGHGQALVDAAYFTNALIRAPKALWEPLDATTRRRIIDEIVLLRRISPPYSNWLLFAAMNEAFLLSIGEPGDVLRIDLALKKMEEWYVGDGWVADGPRFHFDYYNAYVIYPMLVEILEVLVRVKPAFNSLRPDAELAKWQKRAQRFAAHLERFVSPSGSYPPIGRSLTYRTAAFQPLALLAWRKALPAGLSEGQVRSALTAVHRSLFTAPSNFTSDGYLTIGFVGHQPALGDWYSNNGSMYITAAGFLALGLPATDPFWTAPAEAWTQQKAFAGQSFPKDYAVEY
jgi:hypothetical protein